MGFLDLVQQQHAMRMLVDAIGEQATLVETDISPGGAPIRRLDGVALRIYSALMSEAQEFHAPGCKASCLATSVLPTPVGPENR